MELLDPKNDVVFKLMLTADEEIRISLLTAILRPLTPMISATVTNPELPKRHLHDKDTLLDILVTLDDGRRINLEMQMTWLSYIPQRAYFYAAKLLASQLRRGQRYERLKPVASIFLLNEVGFRDAPEDHAHYRFTMKEDRVLTTIAPLMSLHFIEISKLISLLQRGIKPADEMALANWCQFLYNPANPDLEGVFATMPAIKKARKTLEQLSADENARELARMRDKGRRDFNSEIYHAKSEGIAEGLAKGIAEGTAKGIAEGTAKGIAEGTAKGIAEGTAKGIAEGTAKGIAEGTAKGIAEGTAKGIAEGTAKGEAAARQQLLRGLLSNPLTASLPDAELAALCGLSIEDVNYLRSVNPP